MKRSCLGYNLLRSTCMKILFSCTRSAYCGPISSPSVVSWKETRDSIRRIRQCRSPYQKRQMCGCWSTMHMFIFQARMYPGFFINLDPFLWRCKPPAFYPRDYPVKIAEENSCLRLRPGTTVHMDFFWSLEQARVLRKGGTNVVLISSKKNVIFKDNGTIGINDRIWKCEANITCETEPSCRGWASI